MRTLRLVLCLVLSGCMTGSADDAPSAPVPSAGPSVGLPDGPTSDEPVALLPMRADPTGGPGATDHPPRPVRPHVAIPEPQVIVVERAPQPSGHRASGVASWFCGHGSACTRGYAGGLYAAAGPALRRGDWRGRLVVVQSGLRHVTVRLIDWCACPSRLLDLYSDAFQRLAPLSRGLAKVTVSW